MRYLTIALWLLMWVTPCAAQDKKGQPKAQSKPDLSGTWVYDPRQSYPVSRRGPISETLTIMHHEPEIRMRSKLTSGGQEAEAEVVLYTDGRGERNAGYTGRAGYSKTEWDGRALVTRYKSSYTSVGWTRHNVEVTQRWELSKDGKTLIRKTVRRVWPNNSDPGQTIAFYRRVP
jgi:hypothetical protein